MHDTQRAEEEIDRYEACLARLKPFWFEKQPGPWSEELTETIEELEVLADTTIVLDVEIRLNALLHRLFHDEPYDSSAWKKAGTLLVKLQAMPSLKTVYLRPAVGDELDQVVAALLANPGSRLAS